MKKKKEKELDNFQNQEGVEALINKAQSENDNVGGGEQITEIRFYF